MNQVFINSLSFTHTAGVPESWNGMTPDQALQVLHLLQLEGASLTAKRLAILKTLLNLSDRDAATWQSLAGEEFGEQLQELLPLTDFLLVKNEEQNSFSLNPALTNCPVPVLKDMPTTLANITQDWHAPADNLANITALEMAVLFELHIAYTQTQDPALVDRLIAVLYRPGKPATEENMLENYHGDRRIAYNEATVDIRQQQVAKLQTPLKNLIFFWFFSCRNAIVERFSDVFETSPGEPDGKDFGWWAVFRQLSGNLKDTEAMSKMNHLDLLTELSFLKEERRKEEMRAAMAGG